MTIQAVIASVVLILFGSFLFCAAMGAASKMKGSDDARPGCYGIVAWLMIVAAIVIIIAGGTR